MDPEETLLDLLDAMDNPSVDAEEAWWSLDALVGWHWRGGSRPTLEAIEPNPDDPRWLKLRKLAAFGQMINDEIVRQLEGYGP